VLVDPADTRVHRPFAIDVAALLRAVDEVAA
jgi:hypothetical protein